MTINLESWVIKLEKTPSKGVKNYQYHTNNLYSLNLHHKQKLKTNALF